MARLASLAAPTSPVRGHGLTTNRNDNAESQTLCASESLQSGSTLKTAPDALPLQCSANGSASGSADRSSGAGCQGCAVPPLASHGRAVVTDGEREVQRRVGGAVTVPNDVDDVGGTLPVVKRAHTVPADARMGRTACSPAPMCSVGNGNNDNSKCNAAVRCRRRVNKRARVIDTSSSDSDGGIDADEVAVNGLSQRRSPRHDGFSSAVVNDVSAVPVVNDVSAVPVVTPSGVPVGVVSHSVDGSDDNDEGPVPPAPSLSRGATRSHVIRPIRPLGTSTAAVVNTTWQVVGDGRGAANVIVTDGIADQAGGTSAGAVPPSVEDVNSPNQPRTEFGAVVVTPPAPVPALPLLACAPQVRPVIRSRFFCK